MKFDFKDLMAFGMFILTLLTLIIQICQYAFRFPQSGHRKATLVYLPELQVAILSSKSVNPLWDGCSF